MNHNQCVYACELMHYTSLVSGSVIIAFLVTPLELQFIEQRTSDSKTALSGCFFLDDSALISCLTDNEGLMCCVSRTTRVFAGLVF